MSQASERQRLAAIARHLPDGYRPRPCRTASVKGRAGCCEICGGRLDPILADAGRHLLCH